MTWFRWCSGDIGFASWWVTVWGRSCPWGKVKAVLLIFFCRCVRVLGRALHYCRRIMTQNCSFAILWEPRDHGNFHCCRLLTGSRSYERKLPLNLLTLWRFTSNHWMKMSQTHDRFWIHRYIFEVWCIINIFCLLNFSLHISCKTKNAWSH